jgi:hypothetical protein
MAEFVGTSSRLVDVVGPMKVSPWTSEETDAMKRAIKIRGFIEEISVLFLSRDRKWDAMK